MGNIIVSIIVSNKPWSEKNEKCFVSSRMVVRDEAVAFAAGIDRLVSENLNFLPGDMLPKNLNEIFTTDFILSRHIKREFFVRLDMLLERIEESSKLLQFFRSCSEKEFDDWFSNREPITDEVRQKRWNLASTRHEKRVNHAIAEREKERVKRAKERVREETVNSPRGGNFQSVFPTSSYNGSSSYSSAKEGFNARRGYE